MTNDERIKYYMGRWYDEKIILKKEDFTQSLDCRGICFVEKSMLLESLDYKSEYKKELYTYFTDDGNYLVALGDIKLDIKAIKKQTNSKLNDIPILTKASWAGERRMGILLKLTLPRHWTTKCHVAMSKGKDILWNDKIDDIIWRGGPTTIDHLHIKRPLDEMDNSSPRANFIRLYYKDYNVGFHKMRPYAHDSWHVLLKDKASSEDQFKYKYLVSLEGNDVASGLKWQLLSNSVVIMAPPTKISWAMEDTLIPYEHYVPLNPSLDNLEEILQWCKENDDACQKIAKQATQYMQQFNDKKNEKLITDSIIKRYEENVTFI
ncbi:MAG: hypothetical protein HRT89_01990 [Lentisphaeria bacterium]|nr:hypothetical protein [Lentisphaeria bacterium]NQZ66818.1 hypothetical protein [Lentisphaeria bacterium]